jgi:trehalose 6-phosphate phosphatase
MTCQATVMSRPAPSLTTDLKKTAILLDVDGTILDIAPTPREVFVPRALRDTLVRLWQRTGGALAFVSGRPVSELDLIFSPLQLPAIGGHGAELRVIAGEAAEPSGLPSLDAKVKRQFAAIAEAAPGIILEDKGYSLALHYRLAPDKERVVRQAAARICAGLGDTSIELLPGKLVVEIKQTGVTKATAVRELMTHPPFAGRRPIFIGDDVTDLSVFKIVPDFDGISICVGPMVSGVDFCFEQPVDVRRWLEQISRSDAFATS